MSNVVDQNADRTIAVEAPDAVYFFFIYEKKNLARVTKYVITNGEEHHRSSSFTLDGARTLYSRLVNA
jgi:hypothetical protein